MNYIESPNNAKIKQWRKLFTKKERDRTNLFLIEGFHLVEEALKRPELIVDLVVSEEIDLPLTWEVADLRLTTVTTRVMKQLTDTETPQGLVAICRQMKKDARLEKAKTFIFIDEIQDPGNVGTIIRTADAAGIDAIIVGDGSADVYQPKVVRAAQGSHFHLPILKGNLLEWIDRCRAEAIPVYGTALENSVLYTEITVPKQFALIVGNEGSGVAEQLLEKTTANVHIPIYGDSESLNVAVAAGILMYHFQTKAKMI